jgi:uncharacterized membrane protein
MSNQRQVKKLYAINLETYTFQGFINISSDYNKSQVSGLSDWSIVIILGSIILIILLIAATCFCLHFKKHTKINDSNSEQEIHELWASTYHLNVGIKPRASPFDKNKRKTGGLNDTILIDGSVVHYECFQYEVDLESLEIIKVGIM